ncbi:MAG: endonuclease/exonuclease/phosphatase family protein, partial [Planctomycetota bacterium]
MRTFPSLLVVVIVVGAFGFCAPSGVGSAQQSSEPPKQNKIGSEPASFSTPIRIVAWNVESGGNDPGIIALQLKQFGPCDVFALSEVSPRSFERYATALGSNYQSIASKSGGGDRLQVLFRSDRFELIRNIELTQGGSFRLNDGNHRSPLLVHLRDRATNLHFQVVANHLARGNAELREEQASGLREWARHQTIPTVTIGDFNFDYSFVTGTGNPGFAAMMRDGVWKWVQPEEWIDTNWSDGGRGHAGDGMDDFP